MPQGPAHCPGSSTAAAAAAAHPPARCLPPPAGPSTPPVAGVATLYRRTPAWADYAEVLAAVQLGQPATALHYVEGRHGGPPAALAVGDAAGGLHLLSPAGQLVAQHYTGGGGQGRWQRGACTLCLQRR